MEFCDNLIFRRRAALDKLGERLLDANRTIGQPNKITVIFGRRISKHYRGKLQTEIEDMDLPNPVIRSHYGNGFVKQYVRDHLMLRTEAASNNVNDYGVNKSVENLPVLRNALAAINDNYLNVQQDILETFIDRGQLRQARGTDHHADGKAHPRPQARPPAATRLDARARALRPHRRRQHLYHRGTLSACPRRARLPGRTLHPRLASLRPGKTPGQKARRQASPLPPLSTAAAADTQSA